MFLFRVDAVPDLHEMFVVAAAGQCRRRAPALHARAIRGAAQRDQRVRRCLRGVADIDTRIDGRMMAGTLVTGNFFQVVGVNAVMGRTLTPADDERFAGNPVMVLSYRGWDRVFASDPAILGRRVLVNGAPHEIIGVMPEGFRGLAVSAPDYWAPLSLLGQFRPIHRGNEESRRPRHHRPPATGAHATGGARPADRVGFRPAHAGATRGAEHQAAAASRHHPAAARNGRDHVAVVLRVWPDPDDRLRQRRQSPARPRRRAPARDRRAPVARRVAATHRPAVADRKPAAGAAGGGRSDSRSPGWRSRS